MQRGVLVLSGAKIVPILGTVKDGLIFAVTRFFTLCRCVDVQIVAGKMPRAFAESTLVIISGIIFCSCLRAAAWPPWMRLGHGLSIPKVGCGVDSAF